MSELKPCPFCGHEASESFLGEGFVACGSFNCQIGMTIFDPNSWNTRPIEDALLARAEKAEAVINGMYPMWISAMSYCEHGHASDLDRMINYYKGRDNPLTSEQVKYLFSLI